MYSTYRLQANDTLWSHTIFKHWFVKDFEKDRIIELKAQVASGDYFITLATKLDDLSQQLAEIHPAGHITLEKIIEDLSYLQSNYRIKRQSLKC